MSGEQNFPAGAPAGSPAPADAAAKKKQKGARPWWLELSVLIALGLAASLVIKTFAAQAFYIPSSSMENTLEIGNMVLVNKLVYHFRPIARGDIVVFSGVGSWYPAPPATARPGPVVRAYDATLPPLLHSIAGLFGTSPGPADFIKRVIGVPGDHVACCTAQGLLTVNGVPLHENSYLYPGDAPGSAPVAAAGTFSVTVPPGRLWVMGDHRGVSDDSRLRRDAPGGGTIPEARVVGRAFMIVWPLRRWGFLPIPPTFAQPGLRPAAAAASFSAAAAPAAPYLPAGTGFALALPLTWLLRRARLRGPGRRGAGGLRARRGRGAAPPAAAAVPPESSQAAPPDSPRTP
jgi:signal peptidase I